MTVLACRFMEAPMGSEVLENRSSHGVPSASSRVARGRDFARRLRAGGVFFSGSRGAAHASSLRARYVER